MACELDGHPVDREKLLATLCNQLEVNLQKSQKELFEEFLRHSLFKPGDPILVHEEFGKTHEAEIIEIKETWRVLVKCKLGVCNLVESELWYRVHLCTVRLELIPASM